MSVDLHDLVAPPPRGGFREELWERAAAREQRDRRLRRVVVTAALGCAAAACAAAGVRALQSRPVFTGTFDEAMSCPVAMQGGAPVVRLSAHSSYSTVSFGKKINFVSAAFLLSGSESLGAVAAARRGYGFPADGSCKAAARVPLTPSGLPLYDVYKPGQLGLGTMENGATCLVGGHVRVRVQAVVRKDLPTAGKLAMWSGGKKPHPVVYVDWAPKRVAVYMSDDCRA
jgi:hypothetical protein